MVRTARLADLSCQYLHTALAALWCRALALDACGLHDDFFAQGGDSMAAIQLLSDIERQFGVAIPLRTLQRAPTVAALAQELLAQHTDHADASLLVPVQPHGARPPFFCVHGVGGTTASFARLAHHLGTDRPFIAIRARGADDESEPIANIVEMAATYIRSVRAHQPQGPYYLGGYSFGGSVALEMAQQLRAAGEHVAVLAILDHTPPPLRYTRFVNLPRLPVDFSINAVRWLYDEIRHPPRGSLLANFTQLARKANRLLLGAVRRRSAGSGWSDVNDVFEADRLPDRFRQVMAVHYQALRDYMPLPYSGRILLLRARTRPLFRVHGNDLGWRAIAHEGLEIVAIPGNHNSVLTEPNVQETAAALRSRLDAS
jgi:thioesterase domain-containing protein/aryl carrier-like protein